MCNWHAGNVFYLIKSNTNTPVHVQITNLKVKQKYKPMSKSESTKQSKSFGNCQIKFIKRASFSSTKKVRPDAPENLSEYTSKRFEDEIALCGILYSEICNYVSYLLLYLHF